MIELPNPETVRAICTYRETFEILAGCINTSPVSLRLAMIYSVLAH